MRKTQRVRYDMFRRVRNFGIAHRDAFPESSAAGQKFAELEAIVEEIDSHLLGRTEATAKARKLNAVTRSAVLETMRAIAITGTQAVGGETGTNPFRLPRRRGTPDVLAAARYFLAEAERRREKFVALGMQPGVLTEFARQIDALEAAIDVQQDSRAARRAATDGLISAIVRGRAVVAQLHAMVINTFASNSARLGEWLGAHSVDDLPSSGPAKKPGTETGPVAGAAASSLAGANRPSAAVAVAAAHQEVKQAS